MQTHCAAIVKRTGKICGRKALENGFCGYHPRAALDETPPFQADYSLETPAPRPPADPTWNILPFARVDQALPHASLVTQRFNLADFRFIL